MISRWEGFAADLKPVGMTDPTPGLPYIAAAGAPSQTLFPIVSAAIAALPEADRDILRLRGFVAIPAETYLSIPIPPTPADLGFTG